jgi:hypothetical protein
MAMGDPPEREYPAPHVVPLRPVRMLSPAPRTVEILREALAEAEEGKLAAVALASVYTDGQTSTTASENNCAQTLIGVVTTLQYRLLKMKDEE